MRSCCAVYVDVGYLLAAAATRVTGSSLRRGVQTDYATLITALATQAEADSGLPLLRVIWYDAGGRPGGRPDLSQDEIGLLPRVKLRLGRLSYTGEQKGVDVRIGLDLAIQARQRVADVVYLVSGDDDLTEAVEEAQAHGVQVVLLAVPRNDGHPLAVSKHLLREVDRTLVIDPQAVDGAVLPRAIPEALLPAPPGEGADESAPSGAPPSTEDSGTTDDASTSGAAAASGADCSQATKATDTAGAPSLDSAEATTTRPGSSDGIASDDAEASPTRVRRRVTRVAGVPVPGTRPLPGPPSVTPSAPHPQEPAPARSQSTPAQQPVEAPDPAATTTTAPVSSEKPGEEPTAPPAGLPTPAMFARRKAAGVALPGTAVHAALFDPAEGLSAGVIDAVARQVVVSWCAAASPDSLVDLRRSAPVIPIDLDRALLLDLSSHDGGDDLDDPTRHTVRERFWHHIGRVRPV